MTKMRKESNKDYNFLKRKNKSIDQPYGHHFSFGLSKSKQMRVWIIKMY